MSLAQIRSRFLGATAPLPPPWLLEALARDPRTGAALLLAAGRARRRRSRAHSRRGQALLRHESELWHRGVALIAGVDEAGVGPLAGPVVAAAVILLPRTCPAGLDDSKVLTPTQRLRLFEAIHRRSVSIGIGLADAAEVDELNVYRAALAAMRRAVAALPQPPDHLLVDARRVPGFERPQTPLVHGDALSASIAAASVIAKVTRDRIMEDYARHWPEYGFARHKGYATAAHRTALVRLGPCPIHRRSFLSSMALGSALPVQARLEFS